MQLQRQPVYPILDTGACERAGSDPFELVGLWRARGLSCFQLRAKGLDLAAYLELGAGLKARFPDAAIIANDRTAALDRRETFAGLHLGQGDWAAASPALRERLRQQARENQTAAPERRFVLGYSTHDSVQLAAALAAYQPASGPPAGEQALPLWSYVAVGPLNATPSKKEDLSPVLSENERAACWGVFARAASAATRQGATPPFLVAIGGIEAGNCEALLGASYRLLADPGLPNDCRLVPAVIGAGLRPATLDALIKNVALLMGENSLE